MTEPAIPSGQTDERRGMEAERPSLAVSDRTRVEDALRDSEDRNRALLAAVPDLMFVQNRAGDYIDYHAARPELLYAQPEHFLGRNTRDVLPFEVATALQSGIDQAFLTGQLQTVEYALDLADGKRHFEARVIAYDDRVVSVIRDISDFKQTEAEHAALQVLNLQLEKSESLGRMARAIAHQFNNLLGAVLGNLELAVRDLPDDAGPIGYLNDAMSAARRAAVVSGLMLAYLGQSTQTRMRLDLAEVCRSHLPVLRSAIPQAVVLETDVSRPGPAIMASRHEIEQVLTNIVTNAREAIGDGPGPVCLTLSTVALADVRAAHLFPVGWKPQHPAYACLAVADTGCGIAVADIQHLCDPFYSTKFVGRGLGLPVALGIVRAHGGAIAVESEPGRGSCFRVFLPVCADNGAGGQDPAANTIEPTAPTPAVSTPASITAIDGGGTVLLVEDEPLVRKLAATMFCRLGFTVLEARDGVEAVDVFRQHRDHIRVVLCDLTMPRMGGWETMAALRALAPTIPVVLASGYDEASVMAGDHPAWPEAFLSKPYGLKELRAAIDLAVNTGVEPRVGDGLS